MSADLRRGYTVTETGITVVSQQFAAFGSTSAFGDPET